MNKVYKLLIDDAFFPMGTKTTPQPSGDYIINISNTNYILSKLQIENRPHIWELQEEKLDLRSPEAEKMREEARSKRWEYIPEENDLYYVYDLEYINNVFINKNPWEKDAVDFSYWNIGNCHRTREEARLWGKKYARYFLTE